MKDLVRHPVWRVRAAALLCALTLPVAARATADAPAGPPDVRPDARLLAEPGAPERGLEFITLRPVLFAHDAAELSARAKAILDDTALLLRHTPGIRRVLIDGHADATAGRLYNYRLSDRRAAAVRDYLISRGAPPGLLHVAGYGEGRPTDENWTREGRGRNRRVEIHVVRYK